MINEEIKTRLDVAKNTIFRKGVLPHQLEGALRSMLNVKNHTPEDDLRADEIIAKIYYILGDYEESNKYYNFMLSIKPNTDKYLLGIYKNNVCLGDVKGIRTSLEEYKLSLDGKVNNFDSRLIEGLLHYIETGVMENISNNYKYMYFDMVNNKDVLETYKQLIHSVNRKDFNGAIQLTRELEEYVRSRNIHVEFFSLISLLNVAEKKRRSIIKDNISNKYKELREAVNKKDAGTVFKILNEIKLLPVKDNKLVLQGLYLLVENNFIIETTDLIEVLIFSRGYKEQLKVIRKYISEVIYLSSLGDEEMEVYDDAIELGGAYYRSNDLVQALDAYTWGLYVTNAPIFYYYIGKILYKQCRFGEANSYLKKYIELGGSKLDKAYLYLSKIAEKYGKKKKSVSYSRYVEYCNDVMNKEFDFVSPFDDTVEVDEDKMRMQNISDIGEEYFGENKLVDLEHYVRLIKDGKRYDAEIFLEELRSKKDKCRDDVLVLRIIDRNKTLYNNKRV